MTENKLQLFENPEFGQVRTIVEDGKILFGATDVAKALGYARPENAVSCHCAHSLKRGGVVQVTNQYGVTLNQTIACNLFDNDTKTYLTRIRDSITTNSDAIDVKKQALKQAKARFKKESSNVINFTSQKENNVEAI